MPAPEQPLPTSSLRRHEVARVELGATTVRPATVRVLLAAFLAAIVGVPVIEWTGVRALIQEHAAGVEPGPAGAGLWRRTITANRSLLAGFNAFERALEQESRLGQWLRPLAQTTLTAWLGAGNERVYPGRDGWLFYRPDVEYLTEAGFLDPREHTRRIAAAAEWEAPPQPDPRPAIIQLARDLEARGVVLIVVPVPLKPGVHPERLTDRYEAAAGVLHNPSYGDFVEQLERARVLVFDPSDVLASGGAAPRYLEADTHWRPEAMERVAERLGDFIEASVPLPAAPDPAYVIERVEVGNRGDTVLMLDLPPGSRLFPPEQVWLRRVLRPDGSLWRSSPDADVLLLGDSFSNIYSLASMGWGTSAGFAEQLSYALRRPVDRLLQNDDGAFATRAMLQSDPARLDGTRVVVFQFAARELAFGDWKMLPLR